MELSSSDRDFLDSLESRSLTMILLSQTYMGKCQFINELLTDIWSLDTSTTDLLRTIRIKLEVYFLSNHHISYSFIQNHPTNIATMQAMEIPQTNNSVVNGIGNHYDLKLLITSMNQLSDIDQIATHMTETMFPMFIYIIDGEILSDENINQLKYFRSSLVNQPIFFVRVDPTDT